MKKPPAFLFYPDNWIGGTDGLTFEEQGIYLRLLCFQWNNGPFTDDELRSFLRPFSRQIRAKIKHVLCTFFYQNRDKKWQNNRLEIERQKMLAKSEKASISAKSRWSGDKTTEQEGMRTHDANGYARGHAPAMLSNSNSNTKEDQEANSRVLDQQIKHTPPRYTPSSREAKQPSGIGGVGKEFPTGEQNPIPEPLRTPEFLAAWQRWLDFRLAADGRLNPVQQELQLKTCLERGADKAARDLEASILGNSKGQIFDSDRNFSDKPVDPESPVGDEKTNPKRYTPADFLNCWGHYFAATEPPLMTPGRAKAIAAKLRDPWFVEHFPEAVEKASKTDVFNGKGNWKADVDWFLKGDNAVRVWEGSFDKKNPYAGFPGMSP